MRESSKRAESVLVAHPPFALRVSLTDKLSLTDPAPQYHNIDAGGELDSQRRNTPSKSARGRSGERAALDAPKRPPSPRTRQTSPRATEGKLAFRELNPKIIPDAPRPISQGLSPRFSLSMTRAVHSPTSDMVVPWPRSPDHPGAETRLPLSAEIHEKKRPRGPVESHEGFAKHNSVVQLNHMKDLRARVEQTFGFGPQQAPHSSSSASEALQMGPGSAGPQQAPHSSSSASEALRMGPGSDIRVPLLKLPARVAEAPQAGGAEAPQAARLDYDVADVTGEVPGVGRVPGGMRAGVSASTLSADYASSSTNLVPRFSTQAGEHRAHRKRANNQKNEMASSALQQVTVGPWGGRRWIPPSSRHPRRAQPLRWFRVPRKSNQNICIRGLVSATGSEADQAMGRAGETNDNVIASNHGSSADALLPRLITTPSIVRAHDSSNLTRGTIADSQVGGEKHFHQVGVWMSSMFVASIDMHQSMCAAALEVKAGTGGRGAAWLTAREGAHVRDHIRGSSAAGAPRALRKVLEVPLAMKRNPHVRFDQRHTELFGETSKQTPGAKAPGTESSLTENASVSSRRALLTASTESSSTFLTELEADGGEQRHVSQTARGSSILQTARESSSLHSEGNMQQRATGSQTARVQGSKYDRPKITVNKRRASLNYLAIGAGDNVGDFYKPRAKNPGWNASDFRASISGMRHQNAYRFLSTERQLQEKLVQIASMCLSFHTCQEACQVAAAVRRAVQTVVEGSECIMLRRSGYDQICHYDSARGESQAMTVVKPGTGIIGSALASDSPMSWSLLDMDFDIDISDQELGIKDMGMVYTSPLRTPPAPSVESTPPASFGLLVVQHMFGSFDKHEMDMLCVISEHASSALLRLAGWRGVPSQSNQLSQLGYPFLESALVAARECSYDFVGIGSKSAF